MEALEADAPQPTQQDRPLLLIAFVGYVSWLFTQTWIPKEGIGAQLFYAVIGGGLGLGTLLVAFPRGTTVLLQSLGLLAPYGCLLAVLTALHVVPVRMAQFHLVAPLAPRSAGTRSRRPRTAPSARARPSAAPRAPGPAGPLPAPRPQG